MSKKYAPCKKGCCWNPFGTCSKGRVCRCHIDYAEWSDSSPTGVNPALSSTKKPAANVTPLFKEPEHGTS